MISQSTVPSRISKNASDSWPEDLESLGSLIDEGLLGEKSVPICIDWGIGIRSSKNHQPVKNWIEICTIILSVMSFRHSGQEETPLFALLGAAQQRLPSERSSWNLKHSLNMSSKPVFIYVGVRVQGLSQEDEIRTVPCGVKIDSSSGGYRWVRRWMMRR